jgi:hypothetical protein
MKPSLPLTGAEHLGIHIHTPPVPEQAPLLQQMMQMFY